MTTIVYDHKNKQIAIDSRLTKGGTTIISDDHIKWIKNDVGLWFFCGDVCDQDLFMSYHDKELVKQDVTLACSAFLVINKTVYSVYMEGGYFCKIELTHSDCKGSGELLALSALDFGKTAKESIDYAMTRDMFTGGYIHVYDIENEKFI